MGILEVEVFVTFLYATLNSFRVFSYIPQIIAVYRDNNRAKSISLFTWSFWAMSNFSMSLYGGIVKHDVLLAVLSLGNSVCCAVVVCIVLNKRNLFKLGKFKKPVFANSEDFANVFIR